MYKYGGFPVVKSSYESMLIRTKEKYKTEIDEAKLELAQKQIDEYLNIPKIKDILSLYANRGNTKMSPSCHINVANFKGMVDNDGRVIYQYIHTNEKRMLLSKNITIEPYFYVDAKKIKGIDTKDLDLSIFNLDADKTIISALEDKKTKHIKESDCIWR